MPRGYFYSRLFWWFGHVPEFTVEDQDSVVEAVEASASAEDYDAAWHEKITRNTDPRHQRIWKEKT